MLRLAHRRPFAAGPLLSFLADRAVPGIEVFEQGAYRRSLRLPHGEGTVALTPADGFVSAVFSLADLRDLSLAVAKCRHLLNLDSDPEAVDEALGADPLLAPLVKQEPGRRVAGATDGFEIAVRAILGQQVSLGSARRMAGGLVERAGSPLEQPLGPITHTFPEPGALAELAVSEPAAFPMPASRRRALQSLSEAVAGGKLIIDPGADPAEVEEGLLAIPGVGPWTSSYVAMRAIGDPDAFLPTDLGLRRAASRLGLATDPASLTRLAERWRPWRAYALAHLWSVAGGAGPAVPAAEVAGITSFDLFQFDLERRKRRMTHRIAMETPIGVLTIESNEKAVTLITLPGEAGEHFQAANGRKPAPKSPDGPVPEPLALAVAQLEEYFAGRRQQFDLPLELDGTDFQRRVWLTLAEIPYGETVSYAELAMMVGRPNAYRAVGQANGANPIPIVLPCHRVLASGGGLGGYGGGLPMKRQLLEMEGVQIS